ncbi:hypothetical protein EZS27_004051 [termite gut metagenome]|uniref:Uncharacterized protein n=1 Tax=termite gut metagenome TaxID=433724 RepID=A0A5J4SSR5_9ZZZZ
MLFNLPKSDKNAKLGMPKYRLYVALWTDVDVENWPVAVNATISSSVLKEDKKYTYLDVRATSIKPNTTPGESPYNGKLILTPIIEGISKESLKWIYDNSGEDCVVVWERCSDAQKFIGGSPCSSGLQLKYTAIGPQDGGIDGIAISFEGGECPEPFYFYDGPVPVEEDPIPTPPPSLVSKKTTTNA